MLTYVDAIAGAGTTSEPDGAERPATPRSASRQYRLDSGVAAEENAPLGLPNLAQFPAFDTMLPAENG
jgi:hypothetical protein